MPDKTNQLIIRKLIERNTQTRKQLSDVKRKTAGGFRLPSPSNTELFETYRRLLKRKNIKRNPALELLLKKRAVRTLSGVAVVAVLTKPYPCPGKCAYCPSEKDMPKSYLSNEPAVMRAVLCDFHPYKQVEARLQTLEKNGHPTDKIELIVMGGTWSYFPTQYQSWFIRECFRAANAGKFKVESLKLKVNSLKEVQKINEKSKHRIVGLTLETRPDRITPPEIKRMRDLGATRAELGVQSTDDSILQLNKRGHNVKSVIRATELLKNAGFKICYHLMPNLPGSNPLKDLKIFKELFSNSDFQPDMLKIYPCVVTKDSEIYQWWKKGNYRPYAEKQLIELLIKIKGFVPPYARISRLIRDIPSPSIIAGSKISNLREVVWKEMKKRKLACQCIRCREIKGEKYQAKNIKFVKREYAASGGQEYFLSYEDAKQDKLLAFLRLRIPPTQTTRDKRQETRDKRQAISELRGAALIREVHTYGQAVEVGKRNPRHSGASQHFGFGKKLMSEAEKIARKAGLKKIAVISGIGVREYYRKLGYGLEGTYMVKYLAENAKVKMQN